MKPSVWVFNGYKDAQDGTVYSRSPSPDPPPLPDSHLPREWQDYFLGWQAGIHDGVRKTLSAVRAPRP